MFRSDIMSITAVGFHSLAYNTGFGRKRHLCWFSPAFELVTSIVSFLGPGGGYGRLRCCRWYVSIRIGTRLLTVSLLSLD